MAFVEVAANSDSGAYSINNSLRFDGTSSYLRDTLGTPTSQRKLTLSAWTKGYNVRSGSYDNKVMSVGESGDSHYTNILNLVRTNGTPQIYISDTAGKYLNFNNTYYKDPSAWYHWVVQIDTTQSTATNRLKWYVNGEQLSNTLASHEQQPDEDYDIPTLASGQSVTVGADTRANTHFFDGYIAELHFCDGQIHAPSEFGETNDNGVWVPKKASVTYGNNGFFLEFIQTGTSANASGIGADTSGNGNHLAVTGLAATDVTTDTPTNNFATLNPLYLNRNIDSGYVYSEGNTRIAWTSNNDDKSLATSTIGVTSGKWYFEAKVIDNSRGIIGVGDMTQMAQFTDAFYDNDPSYGMGVYLPNGNLQENNTSAADWSSDVSDNDICMLALDMDNHRCWFGINGTWQDSGDPTSGSTGTGDMTTQISDQSHINTGEFIFPFFGDVSGTEKTDINVNFGNPSFSISSGNADANGYGNFEYAPPSGFYALCTKNLAKYG